MGTNEKTATTEAQKKTETQKIRKLQPRKAQKTTETQNIKTLEVGISLDPWSVVKLTKL